MVWVRSTTVAAERKRLSARLAKARAVFGSYAETTQTTRASRTWVVGTGLRSTGGVVVGLGAGLATDLARVVLNI